MLFHIHIKPQAEQKKTHPRKNLNFVAFKTVSIGLISNQM